MHCRFMPTSRFCSPWLGAVFLAGRILAACVETWAITSYLKHLIDSDVAALQQRAVDRILDKKTEGAKADNCVNTY